MELLGQIAANAVTENRDLRVDIDAGYKIWAWACRLFSPNGGSPVRTPRTRATFNQRFLSRRNP